MVSTFPITYWATYMGDDPDQQDAINTGAAKSGNTDVRNNLIIQASRLQRLQDYFSIRGFDKSGRPHPNQVPILEIDHYIDYLLINMWDGNYDWLDKNFWIGCYHSMPSRGFRFCQWDMENTMGNSRERSPLNHQDVLRSAATEPHFWLQHHPEDQLTFANRVQKHFFNNSTLTTANLQKRYRQWAIGSPLAIPRRIRSLGWRSV
ncbi:MAG: hypothetical protein M2R45_01435 [Verrucomicrobia subdivision 3 bacterium]|nr:hypothetical protein [Limisphaerales bacterium]MCS1417619.1 hypothetical protein [Limisphaerales bacterium]